MKILFVDDNLTGNRAAARDQLLPALVRWQAANGPTSLMTQASLNLSDDEALMELMSRAGFDTVFMGIETSDPAALAECGKTPNLRRDVLASVRRGRSSIARGSSRSPSRSPSPVTTFGAWWRSSVPWLFE